MSAKKFVTFKRGDVLVCVKPVQGFDNSTNLVEVGAVCLVDSMCWSDDVEDYTLCHPVSHFEKIGVL